MADHTMGLMMSIDHHLSHTPIHTGLPLLTLTGLPATYTDLPLIHTGLLHPTLTGLLLPTHTGLPLPIQMSLTLNNTREDARVLHLLFLAV